MPSPQLTIEIEKPEVPPKERVSLYVLSSTMDKINLLASKNSISVNVAIIAMIDEALKARGI